MINKILIGSDEGAYTVANGARTITLTGLSFTPTMEQLAYVYNKTQDKLYYAPAPSLAKCTLSSGVITIDSTFPVLATGDVVHIQMWLPERAYDPSLDIMKVVVQNSDYTGVETLVDEADIAGAQATGDAGGTSTTIVDADGAFSIANVAVGYKVRNRTESVTVNVISVDSATQITTGAVTSWASDAYTLPLVKRYEINMEGWNYLSLQYYLRNAASLNTYLQIWGTNNAAANTDSDAGWVNMSASLLGAAAGINCTASDTKEDLVIIDKKTPILKFMVKLVVECDLASGQDNDYEIYIKKSK
jgi:hypothetical protein